MEIMKKSLRKYWQIYITDLQEGINYRAEMLLWSVIDSVPILGMLVLWFNVFSSTSIIGDYNYLQLIGYYVVGYLFSEVFSSHFEDGMVEQVLDGSIVRWFIRPVSLKRFLYVHEMGWRTMTVLTVALPILALSLIFVPQALPHMNLISWVWLIVFGFINFTIEVMLSLMVLAVGFVFEQARSLKHLKWMLQWLLSGAMMPLSLLPKGLRSIADFSPFKFRHFIPVTLLFGRFTNREIVNLAINGLVWCIALLLVVRILWKYTVRKFTAVGN